MVQMSGGGIVLTTMIDEKDALKSDFLFARPSFVEGVARMADVGNALNTYNTSRTGELADARAMYRDWQALAHDLRTALHDLQAESRR